MIANVEKPKKTGANNRNCKGDAAAISYSRLVERPPHPDPLPAKRASGCAAARRTLSTYNKLYCPRFLKYRRSGGGWFFLVGIRKPSALSM